MMFTITRAYLVGGKANLGLVKNPSSQRWTGGVVVLHLDVYFIYKLVQNPFQVFKTLDKLI